MKDKLSIVWTLILLAMFCFGAYQYMEKFALKEALAQTDKKVDYHIINQQREILEYRVEKKSAEYKKEPTKDKKELLDDLKKRLAEKKLELKRLEQKK